jgi:hypothetical protein
VPTLPDPAFAADGRITFPGFTAKASLEGVQAACGSIPHSLPPNPSASGGPPSDIAALLRFAQCKRTHALRSGALSYLTKTARVEEITAAVRAAAHGEGLLSGPDWPGSSSAAAAGPAAPRR